ncbi:MAG: cytochrome bc complex cytochrome b subunit [Cyanobacteria bacterium CRU_2_1]|nr:cytochrome bc complex cytochrome b subunit [Cyanobacteria bacterium CRU_2_1]
MKTLDYRFTLQRISTVLAVVALSLVLMTALTGILLAFYYEPTAGGAFESLRFITEYVSGGALVRSIHAIAGDGIIGVALLQIVVMFLGRQFRPAWLTAWVSGVLLTLSTIALSWTAIVLDWDQVGYWQFKIELGIIESIPLIGTQIRDILTGGGGISSVTVQHLYTLHSYVLSAVALTLAIVHLGSLVYQQQERQQIRRNLDVAIAKSESESGELTSTLGVNS